jgi:hypothetical protein
MCGSRGPSISRNKPGSTTPPMITDEAKCNNNRRASVTLSALTTEGILTKFVRGVTFKGSKIDEQYGWRWIPA